MDEKLLALFQVSPTLVQPRLIHFCEGAWMRVEGKEREFSQVKLSKKNFTEKRDTVQVLCR